VRRVGILGGGQLGRMLAQAGEALGIECRLLDPSPDACAGQVAQLVVGSVDDHEVLASFAEGIDVVTYEHENLPPESLEFLASRLRVAPGPGSLRISRDRLLERRLFARCNVAQPVHRAVSDERTLDAAIRAVGTPGFLKRRAGGYDGRGQAPVQRPDDASAAWASIGNAPATYEAHVHFDRELSIVGIRVTGGETRFYPLVESVHERGTLVRTLAPAPGVTPELESTARRMAGAVADALDHVGTFALELFDVRGELLANEFAGRVHNTGHWTIEGAETSQFENHLRAITGMTPGPTTPRGHTLMLNLLGRVPDALRDGSLPPGVHVHLYGKRPAPRRKLGHVTLRAAGPAGLGELRDRLEPLLGNHDTRRAAHGA